MIGKDSLYVICTTFTFHDRRILTLTFFSSYTFHDRRILAEFQSRKAHRVHVRDKDLLKSLAVILVVVIGYMAAWTAVNADHLTHAQGATLLEKAVTTNTRLSYVLCRSLWWDYVIEIGW